MRTKLEQLAKRLDEIDVHLSDEHAARDMNRFRTLGQERSEIEPVVSRFHDYRRAESDLQSAQQMLSEPEMKALAEEEIDASKARIAALEGELQGLLLPRDPNDDRNIFLEIRAGTGGDESGLFAGDLLRMYMRYAERHRWSTEMISESASDMGGYKEVIVRLGRSRRLLEAEVRIGRPSSAARAGDRSARAAFTRRRARWRYCPRPTKSMT